MPLKTERGNVTLLGATLTSLLSLFLLFLVVKMQIEYREAQYRKKSYLCFRYLTIQTEDYVSHMTKLNWALRTAYAAQFSVTASEAAVVIFKNLVLFRNARHISYVKNLLENKYCHFPETADFVKNIPYEVTNIFVLNTLIDETTQVKAHKWKNTLSLTPKNIRASRLFWLTANYSIENAFMPNFRYTSREIAKKELLSLNHLSGSQ